MRKSESTSRCHREDRRDEAISRSQLSTGDCFVRLGRTRNDSPRQYLGHVRHRFGSVIAYPATETDGDIIVEIGPGRGDFLFHLAETNSDKRVYGIEIKGKRFDKLVKRRDKRNLKNLRLLLADAAVALPKFFQNGEVSAIHINFPDPWPKERHAKHRLLKPEFLEICTNALKENGMFFLTTDVEWYANEVFETCKGINTLKSLYESIVTESPEAYPTLFSKRWKIEGRTIYYQKYLKI